MVLSLSCIPWLMKDDFIIFENTIAFHHCSKPLLKTTRTTSSQISAICQNRLKYLLKDPVFLIWIWKGQSQEFASVADSSGADEVGLQTSPAEPCSESCSVLCWFQVQSGLFALHSGRQPHWNNCTCQALCTVHVVRSFGGTAPFACTAFSLFTWPAQVSPPLMKTSLKPLLCRMCFWAFMRGPDKWRRVQTLKLPIPVFKTCHWHSLALYLWPNYCPLCVSMLLSVTWRRWWWGSPLTFIEHWLCARHCVKLFTCIFSFGFQLSLI